MEGNTNSIGVKLNYEGQMRRFPYTGGSYAVFYEQILSLLSLDKTADIVLKYTDDEGDQITISSDLELKSALVPGHLLRITALSKTRAPPTPNPTPVQPQQQDAQMMDLSYPQLQQPPFPFQPQFHHPHAHPHPHPHPHHAPPPGFAPLAPGGFAPLAPGGDFGAFRHGCGRGAKWDKKLEKMEKEGKLDKMEKLAQKRYMKMAKHGFPPHMGPQHMGPHHHPYPPHMGPHHGPHHRGHHHHHHHDKKDKKDKKDKHGDKLVARYVSDVTVEDGSTLAPNTTFVKTWRMRNEGPTWPLGTGLLFISKKSHDLNSPTITPLGIEVQEGEEVNVSVSLVAPSNPGRYTGYWRLSTPEGKKFGQRVWTSIVVGTPNGELVTTTNSSEEEREADRYEALVDVVLRNGTFRTLGIKRHWVFRLLQKCDGDVDKVQAILTRKVEKKLNKNSR